MRMQYHWRRFMQDAWVTYSLLIVCVILLAVSMFLQINHPENVALALLGAKIPYYIVMQAEWWRLLTAVFLHAGLQHLLSNGISIYFIGKELEPIIGHWRFCVLFFVSGIGGNLVSFMMSQPNVLSVGASGAVFGLFGYYLALAYLYPESGPIRQRAQTFMVLTVFNLVSSFGVSDIDIWGHIGGLIYGLLAGFVLQLPHSQRWAMATRIALFGLIIALSGVCVYFGTLNTQQFFRF